MDNLNILDRFVGLHESKFKLKDNKQTHHACWLFPNWDTCPFKVGSTNASIYY